MKYSYQKLIPILVKGNVKFIIIGGVAAVVHGAARATFDLDVLYSRNSDNINHLVQTLKRRLNSKFVRTRQPKNGTVESQLAAATCAVQF